MGLDKYKKTPCGFCFVEYYERPDSEQCMRLVPFSFFNLCFKTIVNIKYVLTRYEYQITLIVNYSDI